MSRRERLHLVAAFALIVAMAPTLSVAQLAPEPDPSPFAPGDLKRPIFDTRTPVPDTASQHERSASAVVAEVDGRPVTLGDVAIAIAELPPSMSALPFTDVFPSVLEQLVRQQALIIRAQQQGLDEDPDVRRKIRAASDRIMANELLRREISRGITERALLDRYDKEIANKPGPDEVHVQVIMMATEEAARAIIAELKAGADFAAVARQSSLDPTAPVGGDLGFVGLDGLNAEVGAVAFSLQPGQFTAFPFRSNGGWFIVKVDERKREPTPPFAVARERMVQEMLREGAAGVAASALAAATVRRYSISGKEMVSGGQP